MTFLGKLLAVLVMVGSVTALTWSVVFTTQKQPWMGVPAKGGTTPAPVNPIATIAEAIKSADAQHDAAAARSLFAQAETVLGEIRKPIRREYYERQLQQVRVGTPENPAFPVARLVGYPNPAERLLYVDKDPAQAFNLGADGRQIVAPKRDPIPTSGKLALLPIAQYQRQILLKDKEALDQEPKKVAAIEGMKALTLEIGGMGETKGLRTLIVEQEKIGAIVKGELEYLNTIARNRQVDRLIFSRRLASMEAREKELRSLIGLGAAVSGK